MAEIELLDAGRIGAGLTADCRGLMSELVLLDSVDSTNAEVLRRLQNGTGASGLVCSAEQQTAGRGRRGRGWVSPYATNICLSLTWRMTAGATGLAGLSLAVGVAVSDALKHCGVQGVQLKWPNDVIAGGAKLGGILVEMTADASGACDVVVGVGLNVNLPGDAALAIEQDWTNIHSLAGGEAIGRNQLLVALLNELLPLLPQFASEGFAPWRQRWLELDAYADQPVMLTTGSSQVAGTARGIDAAGALLLETSAGVQAVMGGEVSLRPVT